MVSMYINTTVDSKKKVLEPTCLRSLTDMPSALESMTSVPSSLFDEFRLLIRHGGESICELFRTAQDHPLSPAPQFPQGENSILVAAPSEPWRRPSVERPPQASDGALGAGSGPSRCRRLITCWPARHPLRLRRRGVLVTVVNARGAHDLFDELEGAGHC